MKPRGKTSRDTGQPPLIVAKDDYEALLSLALAALDRLPDVAGPLLEAIERAEILPRDDIPDSVVTMDRPITFREDDTGRVQTVRLVYPREADIAAGKVSVLTPMGAALIGLSQGRTASWITRDGHQRSLTVLEVGPGPQAGQTCT